jgi:3-mercaptopyruvate sulfurtransferase SseA
MNNHLRGGRRLFYRKFVIGIISVLFLLCLFLGSQDAFATFTSLKVTPIVETQWLEENLDRADLRIFYMDDWPSKKIEFENKHVPGSVYIGVGTFMEILGNGSTPPDKAKFEKLMGGLGVTKDDYIVVYGWGGKNPFTME